jgi:hypothetical protein
VDRVASYLSKNQRMCSGIGSDRPGGQRQVAKLDEIMQTLYIELSRAALMVPLGRSRLTKGPSRETYRDGQLNV